ncbi:hypothetical protein FO470_05055 [Starkeya sp. 3C]|uniref:Uncharacterized protein n=1 Tax=Ancylobacter moscoviensis TaxID=2597768 RepID=A0ABY3DWT5_9HYPH|nr:hypothetical protein [Ancylobacter moscoviensis]TSJ64628.1 hypothetical protein FO470_05055 [Ancylobacter moscoviensis]
MQSYEIVIRKFIRPDGKLRPAPEPMPDGERFWTGHTAFLPGDADLLKKQVEAVRISFTADIFPAEGGVLVHAGYSDVEKIIKAIRPSPLGQR